MIQTNCLCNPSIGSLKFVNLINFECRFIKGYICIIYIYVCVMCFSSVKRMMARLISTTNFESVYFIMLDIQLLMKY